MSDISSTTFAAEVPLVTRRLSMSQMFSMGIMTLGSECYCLSAFLWLFCVVACSIILRNTPIYTNRHYTCTCVFELYTCNNGLPQSNISDAFNRQSHHLFGWVLFLLWPVMNTFRFKTFQTFKLNTRNTSAGNSHAKFCNI